MVQLARLLPLASAILGSYFALAVLKTWPLVRHFGSHAPSDPGDPLLTTWIMAWDVHALTHDPTRLFHANISYPTEYSLAYSDHLLGALPVFAPAYLLSGNALWAANAVFLTSFALSAFAAFWLAYHLTGHAAASFVAGALFGFAPYRFGQISHVQLLNFFWAPLALVFLDRFLRRRAGLDLAAFALCLWLQVLASLYLGFMTALAVALYGGWYVFAEDRQWLTRAPRRWLIVFAVATVLVVLPLHLPYLFVRRAWDATWSLAGMAGSSADLLGYLTAPALMNDLYVRLFAAANVAGGQERKLFPGLVLPALALLGACSSMATLPSDVIRRLRKGFLVILIGSIVISLGPFFVLLGRRTPIPLPYLALSYAIPGWSGMRVPARFTLLAVLAATPLAALGVMRCAELVRSRFGRLGTSAAGGITAFVVLILFIAELGVKPLPVVAVVADPHGSDVYRWLAAERPGPIVELPLEQSVDQRYVFMSTLHWLPLVNGRSGFMPRALDDLRDALAAYPAPRAVAYARALQLGAVVVHGVALDEEAKGRLLVAEARGEITRRGAFGEDLVYDVNATPLTAALRGDVTVAEWLPAGGDLRLGLLLRTSDGRAWRHPAPLGLTRAQVEWIGTDVPRTETTAVSLPIVVAGEEVVAVPLRVRVPARPGQYRLHVRLDTLTVGISSRPIEVRRRGLLRSDDPAAGLAATYSLPPSARTLAVPAGAFVTVNVTATNVGDALWLSRARNDRGVVALRWHWLDGSSPSWPKNGRIRIRYDVLPGQPYRFDMTAAAPLHPGRYVIELGLETDQVGSFADAGTLPIRLPIEVRPDLAFQDQPPGPMRHPQGMATGPWDHAGQEGGRGE